jgi:hypothetical protein
MLVVEMPRKPKTWGQKEERSVKYAPKLNASYEDGGQLKGLEWRRGRTIHSDTNGPFALATRVFMNEFEIVCAQ